jgi:trimeric autotransporter adhesin
VFAQLPPYTPRTNPLQYASLTGPRSWNLDGNLSKYFYFTERFRLEFKLEAYNATNSFIAANPNTSVTSTLFGKCATQANAGREMQYSLRLHF